MRGNCSCRKCSIRHRARFAAAYQLAQIEARAEIEALVARRRLRAIVPPSGSIGGI